MLGSEGRAPARWLLAMALACALGAAGCVEKPTMRLHHAEVSGVRITFPPSLGVLMTIVVEVHNPNVYDVAVRAVRGRVLLANRFELPVDFRADGDGVWLPSERTTAVRVPVSVPVDVAIAVVRASYASPVVPYRFTGRADVTATRTFQLEKDDYSVDEQGSVSRQQIDAAIRGAF